MTKFTPIVLLASTVFLAGCLDPGAFESQPVKVKTPQGTVTCQLYTKERVLWDKATDVPAHMSISRGDEICRNEGYRWKNEGTSRVTSTPGQSHYKILG